MVKVALKKAVEETAKKRAVTFEEKASSKAP